MRQRVRQDDCRICLIKISLHKKAAARRSNGDDALCRNREFTFLPSLGQVKSDRERCAYDPAYRPCYANAEEVERRGECVTERYSQDEIHESRYHELEKFACAFDYSVCCSLYCDEDVKRTCYPQKFRARVDNSAVRYRISAVGIYKESGKGLCEYGNQCNYYQRERA